MRNQRKRIIKLLAESEFSICKICGATKNQAIYRFRHEQYIDDYEKIMESSPLLLKCRFDGTFGYSFIKQSYSPEDVAGVIKKD